MKATVWINQTTATVVLIDDAGNPIVQRIELGRVPALGQIDGTPDTQADRRTDRQIVHDFLKHIATYYEQIVACLDAADTVFIMGPDVAKDTLRRLLELDARHATTVIVDQSSESGGGDMLLRHHVEQTRANFTSRLH